MREQIYSLLFLLLPDWTSAALAQEMLIYEIVGHDSHAAFIRIPRLILLTRRPAAPRRQITPVLIRSSKASRLYRRRKKDD